MIFTADESVDKQIVVELRRLEVEVIYISEKSPGIPDNQVLELANFNKSVLITADKDFGELVYLQKKNNYGVILVRLPGLVQEEKARILYSVITKHLTEFINSFTMITKDNVRIRKYE